MTKIILLNGAPGSGKDTFAKMLEDVYAERGQQAFTVNIAKPLRRMASVVSPVPMNSHDDYERWKNAKLDANGKPDSTAPNGRDVLVALGDCVRELYGDAVFAYSTIREMYDRIGFASGGYDACIVSDLGLDQEAQAFVSTFGKQSVHIVRLWRDGHNFFDDCRYHVYNANWNIHEIKNRYDLFLFSVQARVLVDKLHGRDA